MSHLHSMPTMETDLSLVVPRAKRLRHLPSTYGEDETDALLSCIDRSAPQESATSPLPAWP
jgi:hypothetical protein